MNLSWERVEYLRPMELREFAERVLFARSLEEKLQGASNLTDARPGEPIQTPLMPGRPSELEFKAARAGKPGFQGLRDLERSEQRGRLLHFFANHELLATELMALALLRFPHAPSAFRRGVLQTLKEEQQHTKWYLRRMQECGIRFGELPVSGYFWRSISPMESPLDYVAGLSLTFEQANLDFALYFSRGFAQAGDGLTARLLERIYRDEIGHVACGLKWFRQWKEPKLSDWQAFCRHLKFPMSAQRAKGPVYNVEGRMAAGFDREFIDELSVYAQSRGRTPGVFVFNPFAEGRMAQGKSFTPNRHQQLLQRDLENLPQFLCRQDDVALVARRPSACFLAALKQLGFVVPEFVPLDSGRVPAAHSLHARKIGALKPWAWGPDSLELLAPFFSNLTAGSRKPEDHFNDRMARLYSKEWSASLLRAFLGQGPELPAGAGETALSARTRAHSGEESWICEENVVGAGVATLAEALEQIHAIRHRGHHKVIVKEALGLAGHNALRLFEPALLDSQRRWIARATENGRRLVVEPWLERQFDFSVQFEMCPAGLKLIGYTGLINDWRGQYRGNVAWPGYKRRPPSELGRFFHRADIQQRVADLYARLSLILEKELRQAGYCGPIGLDAFVYRTSTGQCRLKPIVEINPRYTMGRLTIELMNNVAPGKTGTFRLIDQKLVQSEGFDDLSSWARNRCERFPARLEGEPVPRLAQGVVCLNDPEIAQVCLALFEVSPA